MEPIVIQKTWEEQAIARWVDQWSTTEAMALATTVAYMDTNANEYHKIMRHPPPDNITLPKVPRNIAPHDFL
eukprot:1746121-Karenia_brevis.AAC.1